MEAGSQSAGDEVLAVELAETKTIHEAAQINVNDVQKVPEWRENEISLSLSARDSLGDDGSADDEQGGHTESNNSEKDGEVAKELHAPEEPRSAAL